MPQLYTQIAFWSVPTFRLLLALAILVSMAVGVYRLRLRPQVIDAYLGGLIGGMIGARVLHVILNWDYFTDNRSEIVSISTGGLDWHGALLGGMLGIVFVLWAQALYNRWRARVATTLTFTTLLNALVPALPLIGLGGWAGCWAAGCGYGKEVDSLANYPHWAASELVDVFGIVAPRYNTPYFGIALCVLGLLVMWLLKRWGKAPTAHFWVVLALLSFGMLIIGFLRADHTLNIFGLRADQLLDSVICLWSIVIAFRVKRTYQ